MALRAGEAMTNEELALRIKEGNTEQYGELWERTKRFFTMHANGFYMKHRKKCDASGVELDDLIQCCFFALMKTVEAFEPSKEYKLLSYADFHIRNILNEACGMRKRQNEPLNNNFVSIYKPFSEDCDIALLDTLIDENAFREYENIERKLTVRKLREELDRMLAELQPAQSQILRLHYYMGMTLDQIAELRGVERSRVVSIEERALHSMYKPSNRRVLQEFKRELIETQCPSKPFYYRRSGFRAFSRNGGSSVELTFEEYCNRK